MDQYTRDNISGYTQAELDALKAELDALKAELTERGIEPFTDAWWQTIKRHADNAAGR